MKKYELKLLLTSENRYPEVDGDRINFDMAEAQNNGWELAGNIEVKYHGSPTDSTFLYIPLKRELQQHPTDDEINKWARKEFKAIKYCTYDKAQGIAGAKIGAKAMRDGKIK